MSTLRIILAAAFVVSLPRASAGQSLDIGGIELSLGQSIDSALRSLGAYRVVYSDALESWLVEEGPLDDARVLGQLAAKAGRVSMIVKSFPFAGDVNASNAYSLARRDIRRRGGEVCRTADSVLEGGEVDGIETVCGKYRMRFSFPRTIPQGVVRAGVLITLR